MIGIIVYVLSPSDVPARQTHPGVRVVHGDIFACKEADCLVTAGNSFGMMDGGIDGLANYQFGMIEPRVQASIAEHWRGELPVGAALVLGVEPTMHLAYRFLCYAPTMRTPKPMNKTHNAYLATRAALIACAAHGEGIKKIAVPLMCRGVGQMEVGDVLRQIRHAWDTFRDWYAIAADEDKLNGDAL